MKIYNADGTVRNKDVVVTSSAILVQELMKSDYVKLSWSDYEYDVLPAGAYIIVDDVRYTLFAEYKPTAKDELEYLYEPEFLHPKMQLGYTPCLFKTYSAHDAKKPIYETDWQYVGNIGGIADRIVGIISEQTGISMSYVIVGDVPASASCSFGGVDILSALSEVARAFDAEYHIDWESKTIYLGKNLSLGTAVELTEGVNVGVASRTGSNSEVANCYIVRGGTRNITVQTTSGNNVETDTRLSLEGYTDEKGHTYGADSMIDDRTSAINPKLTKVLIFDDVYPKLDLYVYDVRLRVRRLLDENNQPIIDSVNIYGTPQYRKYAIYYMRLAYKKGSRWIDYTIANPKTDIVAGKELMASFEPNEKGEHSALAGREFKLTYHSSAQTIPANTDTEDSGVEIKEGDYEINFEQAGDLIIPNINTLEPWGEITPSERCDKVVLYNLVMSQDYISSAQAELYAEARKEITRLHTDLNNYNLQSYATSFDDDVKVAHKVRYRSVSGYMLDTRVIKIERSLEVPSDVKLTIGNAEVKGNIQSLKEEVASANNEVSAMQAMNEAAAALTNAIANTQNSLKEAMAKWSGLWQFDDDGFLFTPYSLYSLKDISAYGKGSGGGGGGGASVLNDLDDVVINRPSAQQALIFNGQRWVNGAAGLDEAAVGAYLALHKFITQSYITQSLLQQTLGISNWALADTLKAGDVPNLDWTKITSGKPTTMAGYGITDGVSTDDVVTEIGVSGNQVTWTKGGTSNSLTVPYSANSASLGGVSASQYVTTSTSQSITADKTFDATIVMNNNKHIDGKLKNGDIVSMMYITTSDSLSVGYGVASAGKNVLIDGNNVNIRYGTSHATGILLTSIGNVGVGTTTPRCKLDVGGTILIDTTNKRISLNSGANWVTWNAANKAWVFDGNIIATGDVIAYGNTAMVTNLEENE